MLGYWEMQMQIVVVGPFPLHLVCLSLLPNRYETPCSRTCYVLKFSI